MYHIAVNQSEFREFTCNFLKAREKPPESFILQDIFPDIEKIFCDSSFGMELESEKRAISFQITGFLFSEENKSRSRHNVEGSFLWLYYISAGQTSLLQVQ